MADRIPPFFVVGAARSGTTLLRVMLERHPSVAIPPESHFIPRLWDQRRRYGEDGRLERSPEFLRDLAADARYRSWDLPIQAVRDALGPLERPTLADGIAAAFRAYAGARGKPSWGDKTPKYVDSMPLLASLFPAARFVHVVRDGRDVALSVLDMERLHAHAATPARVWARQVHDGRAAGRALGEARYLELRYEDLLEDQPGELRRVCGFLGHPLSSRDAPARAGRPGEHPGAPARDAQRLALPPTKGLRDWRSQMPSRELAEFEAVAGTQLEAFGYTRAAAPPGVATRVRAGLRAAGFYGRYARGRLGVAVRRRRRQRERERAAGEEVSSG